MSLFRTTGSKSIILSKASVKKSFFLKVGFQNLRVQVASSCTDLGTSPTMLSQFFAVMILSAS